MLFGFSKVIFRHHATWGWLAVILLSTRPVHADVAFSNWYDWKIMLPGSGAGTSLLEANKTGLDLNFFRLESQTNFGFIKHLFNRCRQGDCARYAPNPGTVATIFENPSFHAVSTPTFKGERNMVVTMGDAPCLDERESVRMNGFFDTWEKTSDMNGPKQVAFVTLLFTPSKIRVEKLYRMVDISQLPVGPIDLAIDSCTDGAYVLTGAGDRGGILHATGSGFVYSTHSIVPHRVLAYKQLPIPNLSDLSGSYSGFNYDSNEVNPASRPLRCALAGNTMTCNPVLDLGTGTLKASITIKATIDAINAPEPGMFKVTMSETGGASNAIGVCFVYYSHTTAMSCLTQSTSGDIKRPSTWNFRADKHPFAPGSFDNYEFAGASGRTVTDLGGGDTGSSVAIQSDGKIVLAGTTRQGNDSDFAVVRYNRDGTVDTNFGRDGKVITSIGGVDIAHAVALQDNGKIVVAGESTVENQVRFSVARYSPNGALDNTFSEDGKMTISLGVEARAFALAVQGDGKIVVAGSARVGKIVVAGSVRGSNDDFGLVRLNENGSLDTTFSGDGKVITSLRSRHADRALAVAVQKDGKIVVAGEATISSTWTVMAVARYTELGSLDGAFNRWGFSFIAFNWWNGFSAANAIALETNGKIVLAGSTTLVGRTPDMAVVRLNTRGRLDGTFGHRGKVTIDIAGGHDIARALAIQTNGAIVVAGAAGSDAGFVRLLGNGELDPSFDTDGKLVVSGGVEVNDIMIQADGKIVAGGTSNDSDFSLMRLWH